MLSGVHGLGVRKRIVQQGKATTHHRVADLADRHGARHRARPAQPQQSVFPDEVVDGGGAVDPVDTAPQRQRLGVAQQVPDPAADHQPPAQRAAVGLHLRRRFRRADHRPLGQQMPGAFAAGRMRRIFVVDGQLVAHSAVGDQLFTVAHQRCHTAAAGGIDGQAVMLVGDFVARQRLPTTVSITGNHGVSPPPERRHIAGQPADRPAAVLDHRGQHGAVDDPAPERARREDRRIGR